MIRWIPRAIAYLLLVDVETGIHGEVDILVEEAQAAAAAAGRVGSEDRGNRRYAATAIKTLLESDRISSFLDGDRASWEMALPHVLERLRESFIFAPVADDGAEVAEDRERVVGTLSHKLEEEKTRMAVMVREKQELLAASKNLEERLRAADEELESLKSTYKRASKEHLETVRRLKNQLKDAEDTRDGQLASLAAKLASPTSIGVSDRTATEEDGRKDPIELIRASLRSLAKEAEDLKKENADLQAWVDVALNQKADTDSQLADREDRISAYKSKLERMTRERDDAMDRHSREWLRQSAALEGQIEPLRMELTSCKARRDRLAEEIANQHGQSTAATDAATGVGSLEAVSLADKLSLGDRTEPSELDLLVQRERILTEQIDNLSRSLKRCDQHRETNLSDAAKVLQTALLSLQTESHSWKELSFLLGIDL